MAPVRLYGPQAAFPAPPGTPGTPEPQRAAQRLRYRAYSAAMDAAAWVNDRAYNTAIRANRVYGWLSRRRDRRGEGQ